MTTFFPRRFDIIYSYVNVADQIISTLVNVVVILFGWSIQLQWMANNYDEDGFLILWMGILLIWSHYYPLKFQVIFLFLAKSKRSFLVAFCFFSLCLGFDLFSFLFFSLIEAMYFSNISFKKKIIHSNQIFQLSV